MRRRIITDKRRVVTPREWLPVAAAIAEDANERITGAIEGDAIAAAAAERQGADQAARLRYGSALAAIDRAAPIETRAAAQTAAAGELNAAQRASAAVFEATAAEARRAARAAVADLSIHVGPGATKADGSGAPAHYRDDRREVVLDSAVALPNVLPGDVRWSDRRWRLEHLRAAGLVEHEVGHAAHTPRWVLESWAKAGPEVNRFARRLEEARMEAAHLRAGGDREALAGVAHELILREWSSVSGDPFADALDASLILGRDERVGGSLASADVQRFRDAYSAVHGDGWLEALDDLLGEWNGTDDGAIPDGAGMADLLGRWRSRFGAGDGDGDGAPGASEADADGTDGEESGEGSDGGSSSGEADTDGEGESDADSADGSGDGSGEGEADGGEESSTDGGGGAADADGPEAEADGGGSSSGGESEESSTDDGSSSAGDSGEADGELPDVRGMLEEAAGEVAAAAAAEAAELREEEAREDDREVQRVTHGFSGGEGRHQPQTEVVIGPEAAQLRSRLCRELRSLQLPEVARTRVGSQLPPGRLRGRGAVARDAQRAAGMIPTAEPFRATRRSVTKAPPPVVGIMLDVSGSMARAQLPVASLGWALAEAGRSVQARVAVATMGDRGRLVEHKARAIVQTQSRGGWENFREAFNVLDARLHLTAPARGARLLIIVTDGALVGPGEAEAAEKITRWLERHGVAVVWAAIGVTWRGGARGDRLTTGSVVELPSFGSLADAAAPLVEAIEAAVDRARIEAGR